MKVIYGSAENMFFVFAFADAGNGVEVDLDPARRPEAVDDDVFGIHLGMRMQDVGEHEREQQYQQAEEEKDLPRIGNIERRVMPDAEDGYLHRIRVLAPVIADETEQGDEGAPDHAKPVVAHVLFLLEYRFGFLHADARIKVRKISCDQEEAAFAEEIAGSFMFIAYRTRSFADRLQNYHSGNAHPVRGVNSSISLLIKYGFIS